MSRDRLILADIAVECRLGVFEWEQAAPQPITVDLELPVDAAAAASRDALEAAVDYGRLVTLVRELAQGQPYALMETLADDLARRILGQFPVRRVRVRVKKRALPGLGYAAVEVERSRGRRPAAGSVSAGGEPRARRKAVRPGP